MSKIELKSRSTLVWILSVLTAIVLIFSILRFSGAEVDGLAVILSFFIAFVAEFFAFELPYLGYASSAFLVYFTIIFLFANPYILTVVAFSSLVARTIIVNRQNFFYRMVDFSTALLSIVYTAFAFCWANGNAEIFSIRNLLAVALALLVYFLADLCTLAITSAILPENEASMLSEIRIKLRYLSIAMAPVALFIVCALNSIVPQGKSWTLVLLIPGLVALRYGISFVMKTSSKGDEKLISIIRNYEEKIEAHQEEKDRITRDLEVKIDELSIYHEMIGRLSGSPDLEKTLGNVMNVLRKLIPSQSAAIFLCQDNLLITGIAVTPYKDKLEMMSLLGLSEQSIERVQETKAPVVIAEVRNADPSKKIFLNEISQMCVPLMVKDDLLGLMYVGSTTAGFYGEADLAKFTTLSLFAANSIFISLLYASESSEKKRILTFFEKYVSPDVVKEILAKSSETVGLKGERKNVTVLFLDVRSFSSLTAASTPSQIVFQLNLLWAEMGEIIYEHGGTLLSYIGDALLAVFGAPISSGNDTARAIAAAIKMQARMIHLRELWAREGIPSFHIGIGINTGEVIAGDVGFTKHREYTVIGETVNVAARIEKLNKKYSTGIIISESAFQEAGPFYAIRFLGTVSLDATEMPIGIYTVDGMKRM